MLACRITRQQRATVAPRICARFAEANASKELRLRQESDLEVHDE